MSNLIQLFTKKMVLETSSSVVRGSSSFEPPLHEVLPLGDEYFRTVHPHLFVNEEVQTPFGYMRPTTLVPEEAPIPETSFGAGEEGDNGEGR
jgi:hypothetical protein